MRELPMPVVRVLRDECDEVAVRRMWRGIATRRAKLARPSMARWGSAGALTAAAAVVLAMLVGRRSHGVDVPTEPGPLHRVDGGDVREFRAESARVVPLDDGSSLTLAAGARLEALENSGRAFATLLDQGRVAFDVRPHGPRRWSIECGLATVEVVGTRFVIDRDATRVRVSVEHGVVLVRGERVPDRVQRLTAGQSLEIVAALAALTQPGAALPQASGSPVLSASQPAVATARPRDRREASRSSAIGPSRSATETPEAAPWRDLAREGSYARAYGALGTAGIAHEASAVASAADLLALADIARLSGHPRDAVNPLERLLASHASESCAPLAAFTLGRIELDALSEPARAAQAFARAIALGVPRGLAEDAHARLVEARARAGDTGGARDAASEYTRLFPDGRRAVQVRRWTEGH